MHGGGDQPARGRGRPGRARGRRLGLWTFLAITVLLIAYGALLANSRPSVGGDQLRLDTFFDLVGRKRVVDARILDQDAYVVGTYARDDGRPARYKVAYLQANASTELLINLLLENRVPTTVEQQFSKKLLVPATLLVPALIVVVIFAYLLLSYHRGSGPFGVRSGARRVSREEATVTFADVAGQDAAVAELREVEEFLSDPGRFAALGAAVPKGILLYGPPGCGKTLLARALAGEAGAAFFSISGTDFVELYAGVGAARVRDLFAEARANAPAIVFIDELDSVGRRRRGGTAVVTGSGEEQEQALNQVLAELDGFSPLQGTIVVGATNRPDVLDPALLRPGRFDRAIGLERPDEEARLAILSLHARNKPLGVDVDLRRLAKRAVGLSGADLASVLNEGALLAARAHHAQVGQAELDAALTRVLEAPERQRRLSLRDRSFGRSTGSEERVSFADVAGAEEAISELADVQAYLAEPERFAALGARPPRGILLVGPPGCGKTLLARALATEANAAFFSVAATELVEVFAGEGAARVRDLFAEARSAAPAIVFVDELDAIGARRGVASAGGHREAEQTLNQLLVSLDGFSARSGVMAMAATNRPELLDEALVRPGRFDRTVELPLPDLAARRAILAVHARTKNLAADVNLAAVAAMTRGFSGADLANTLNEAALLTARRRLPAVPMTLVEEAIERAESGIARAQALSGDERAIVAYHEAGHALVGRALPGASKPQKISLVARGHAIGLTWQPDDSDRVVYSRSALLDRMAAMLGGRAAESLVFGEPGSGAASDVVRVSELARKMVCELGMSDALGPVAYRGDDPGHSEEAARAIDSEVHRLVDEALGRATAVLTASRAALERVAAALLERETLGAEELDRLAGTPVAIDDRTTARPRGPIQAPRPLARPR